MGKNWAAMGRAWTAAVLASGVSACAAHGTTYSPPLARAGLVEVEVYDRAEGTALPVHTKDGRRYIVGTPGHDYALRIRNRTGARVLAVTSVDGVNVISGDTASPTQSGYVLAPPATAARERSEVAKPHEHGPRSLGKLGTGHGRNEASRVSVVRFERASYSPNETIAIRYDRRENLAAMGVLPWDAPHLTRREPEPFPAMRFAPDPYR